MTAKPEDLSILSNVKIAPGHFIMEMQSVRLAKAARPGQFVQILVDHSDEPFLPRPFSFLDAKGGRIQILYQVVGKGTQIMSKKKRGDVLRVLGPLGNGFIRPEAGGGSKTCMILVGGGVGIPPLYHLAAWLIRTRRSRLKAKDIHVFLGARKKAWLHCENGFRRMGVTLHVATDDGSKGHHGVITEPLSGFLSSFGSNGTRPCVYTCGPTPMLKAVSHLAGQCGIGCQVSVEEPMPCGFGACLGCAIKIRGKSLDSRGREVPYRFAMSCTEGPVFQAKDIVWD